jgi:hypothetical protein
MLSDAGKLGEHAVEAQHEPRRVQITKDLRACGLLLTFAWW